MAKRGTHATAEDRTHRTVSIEHPIVRGGLIHYVPTANELIDRMVADAVDIISRDMLRRIVRPADSITERRRQG
jgi:hypothetical protein